jgi:hypothetical protein
MVAAAQKAQRATDPSGGSRGRLEGGETHQKFGEACGGGMEGSNGTAWTVRDPRALH